MHENAKNGEKKIICSYRMTRGGESSKKSHTKHKKATNRVTEMIIISGIATTIMFQQHFRRQLKKTS